MKKWNFQINSNLKEVTKKLESSLERADRFVLDINSNKKDIVKFKLRKRVSVAFDNNSQNKIIVNGTILSADTENETDIKISFTQHPLLKILWYGVIILGLGFFAALFFKLDNNSYLTIAGIVLLAIAVFFKLHHQKEFDKNVQEYKTMIARILEI